MKKVQDHTRTKGNDYEDNVYGNVDETNLGRSTEMDEASMDDCNKDDVYMNCSELKTEAKSHRSVEKDKTPKYKRVSTSNTKSRLILVALIILIIKFLILSIFTGILLKYYLAMAKEISILKNHTDNQQQIVLEDVKTFKINFENAKQNFLQDIKNINKTLEILCRPCPPGWMSIGLFCYYLSTDSLSWDSAKESCILKRSTLLILQNKEESDALGPLLGNNRYWIGLKRDKDPNKWRWLDGSMLSFSNWSKGEPNNMNTEDCVESWGSWNDLRCANELKYICMK